MQAGGPPSHRHLPASLGRVSPDEHFTPQHGNSAGFWELFWLHLLANLARAECVLLQRQV